MNENEIRARMKICEFCIELLKKETEDPRQPEALKHYQEQLEVLKSRLPRPATTVIGLKTASLSAKVPK
ncbi:MAG: hypothetical protein A2Y88_07110 [Chloroflexi bacterium RBG_13_48_10]|nr:MAG: hypothetical protein A2Y88_07110 [Chloroflexi bacterium RBG_13_48_10]